MDAIKFWKWPVALVVGAASALALMNAMPAWAIALILVICAAVFYATHEIKRDLARLQCELTGHWPTEFKKYSETAYCPRCKDPVRTRGLGADGPGLQFCEDTLHQRISRIETALRVDE